jgi:putative sugar O-methyltransferase
MNNFAKNIETFIKNSPNFYLDSDLKDIDSKHERIVSSAYRQFQSDISDKNFRNWSGQSDMASPSQISIGMMRQYGFIRTILRFFYRTILKNREERDLRSTIHDDIDSIELIGGKDLIIKNPVDSTPGFGSFYRYKGMSVNMRWLRYLYILSRIRKEGMLDNNGIWVDVGSYYGGLQGLVRKYYPDTKTILVDFHHQLCRSYAYLKEMYPDSKHIFPNMIDDYKDLSKVPDGAFLYVPASDFNLISDNRVDLASNFFSLGEMNRGIFNEYYQSAIFEKAKNTYIVNRFVSGPFFEATYKNNTNVLNYISSNRRRLFFDVFPIGNYMLINRKLFDRKYYRNTSSSHFELITSSLDV